MSKKTFKEKMKYIWESPEAFKYIIIGVLVIIAIIGIIWLIITMTGIYNEGEKAGKEISDKNATCELMTDSYNKCSYSYKEKRCVCKRR